MIASGSLLAAMPVALTASLFISACPASRGMLMRPVAASPG